MIQYIVAYEDDNMESSTSVYDIEKSLGDTFTFSDDENIHEFFSELYKQKAGGEDMPKGGLIQVTDKTVSELMDKYPADENVTALSKEVLTSMDNYPSAVFYYTFE